MFDHVRLHIGDCAAALNLVELLEQLPLLDRIGGRIDGSRLLRADRANHCDDKNERECAGNRANPLEELRHAIFSLSLGAFNDEIGGAKSHPCTATMESCCDCLAVGGLPTPGAGPVAALRHALLVDLSNNVAVAGKQRLGRAHFRAQWQLAFGQPIGAVLLVFFLAVVGLRPTGAEGAFVHLAARTKIANLWILRRAKRACVEAIAAADAKVLGVKHYGIRRRVETIYRTDSGARRIGAVHAGHGNRPLSGLSIIEGDHAAAVDAPWHLVLVLAGGDAGVAFDATV